MASTQMDADTKNDLRSIKSTKVTNTINNPPKLVNVLYPGYVKNVDKALQNLGGIKCIEEQVATTSGNKQLELSFKPKNLSSKPVLGDRDTKPQVLVKVKTKTGMQNGKVVSREVTDYNVVGVTAVNFKFNRLCDYQYLPLVSKVPKEVEDELVYIYENLFPPKIYAGEDFLKHEHLISMPLYFVPFHFSKPNLHGNNLQFDRSKFYEGRLKPKYCEKFNEVRLQQKESRKDPEKFTKTAFLIRIDEDIPQEPNPQALTLLREKSMPPDVVKRMKELFQSRPIWSRNALFYTSRSSLEQMKYILPAIAFHYVSGPWRAMWVRLGYDPRLDPSAKSFQTFDYRVRSRAATLRIKVRTKRYEEDISRNSTGKPTKFSLSNASYGQKPEAPSIGENSFVLRPGTLPAARQTFFQFCDIKLPEIENMIAKLPTPPAGATCDWKHGWFPNGFMDQCREITNKCIIDTIAREARELKKGSAQKELPESESEESSSESEISEGEGDMENRDVIDLELVKEINQLLGVISEENVPGPSSGK